MTRNRKKRALLFVLAGWAAVWPSPAHGESLEAAARKVAEELAARPSQAKDAQVTYIEADGLRVYFSGLSALLVEPGQSVVFLRKSDSGAIELGRGLFESSRGVLSWAAVDSGTGRSIQPGDIVQLGSPSGILGVCPFFYEAPDGRLQNITVGRIFRSLVLYDLKLRGIRTQPVAMGPGDFDSAFMPRLKPAAAPAGVGKFLLCRLKRTAASEFSARVILQHISSGEIQFEKEYSITLWNGVEIQEEPSSIAPGEPSGGESAAATPVPDGVLRLSLSTSPTGASGGAGWPPRTPADFLLLDAISAPLTKYGKLDINTGGRNFVFTIAGETIVDVPILEAALNARHSDSTARFLLGDFKFTARSAAVLELEADAESSEIHSLLADPIFRLVDPSSPGLDLGLGSYRIFSVTPGEIVLAHRPNRPFSADTVVLTVDTDARTRQARFELGETDLHEMTDAEFSKYTSSTAYMNRIARGHPSSMCVLLFNLSRAPCGDLAFRRAVSKILDRRAALEVLLNNRGVMADGFYPPDRVSRARKSTANMPARSIVAAKDLIKDIRRPIRLTLAVPEEDPVFSIVAERIQADLKLLGVAIAIRRMPWAAYEESLRTRQFDMAVSSWTFAEPARVWLARHLSSKGPDNHTGYSSAAFDALASAGADLDAAHELLLMELPVLPLFWLSRYAVLGERVESADLSASQPFPIGVRISP